MAGERSDALGRLDKSIVDQARSHRDLEPMFGFGDALRVVWIDAKPAIEENLPIGWTLHIWERQLSREGTHSNALIQVPLTDEALQALVGGARRIQWDVHGFELIRFGLGGYLVSPLGHPPLGIRAAWNAGGIFSSSPVITIDFSEHPVAVKRGSASKFMTLPIAHNPIWDHYMATTAPKLAALKSSREMERRGMGVFGRERFHVILQIVRASVPERDPAKTEAILIFGGSEVMIAWAMDSPDDSSILQKQT